MKEDNQAVIKPLNMYGRVPEKWELLEEIERLNKARKIDIEYSKYLQKEIIRLNNIIKNVEDICESSIVSVNQILQDEKETKIVNGRCINRNEYQIVRLKAYRTKSKEILGRIKELREVIKNDNNI